jgi:CO/xanthine dehydrogenase FAD-binding subunit
MTRQYQIEHSVEVRERCPLLAHAMPFVGHTQTRSRGTLGGSLAFASSVAELGVVLLAVGANVHIAGSAGNRTMSIDGFFVDYLTSALQAGELLTEVTVHSRGKNTRWGFSELKLRSCDFPIVVAAATVALDDSGRCVEARIALGGAAPTPVRVPQAESELRGQVLSARVVETAARAARDAAAEPTEDLRASAAYRRAMVPLQVSQALTMALEGKH